jgi:BASS family bile acid:Na+ symporter
MNEQQAALAALLATMVFSIALELKLADFRRVLEAPKAVVAGLIPQFVLLPALTWLVTCALPLPANVEVAMLLVAACPGGSLSNVLTHFGRGNTALSVSISATASLIALLATPFNFAWMVASNPDTARWMRTLEIDPSGIWISLLVMLSIPMALGMGMAYAQPQIAARLTKPLAKFSLLALLAFIVIGLVKQRSNLTMSLLPMLLLVIAHNASGLLLGWLTAKLFGVAVRDQRAIILESGMQNSGLALGIIALQFGNDLGMTTVAGFWGIWHIVSGLACAKLWRWQDQHHHRVAA